MQSYDARGGEREKCMIKKGNREKKEAEGGGGGYRKREFKGSSGVLSSIISEIWVHKRTFCRNAPGAVVCESLLFVFFWREVFNPSVLLNIGKKTKFTLSRSIPASSRYGTCSARSCADHCGNVGL